MHASHFLWLRRSFPVSISLFNTTFYPASSTSTSAILPPLPPFTSRPFFWIVAYGFFFLGTSFPPPPYFLDVTFFMNSWGCPSFFFPHILWSFFFFSSCLNNNQLKCIQYPSSIVVAIPRPLFPFSPIFLYVFSPIFSRSPATHTHDFGVSPFLLLLPSWMAHLSVLGGDWKCACELPTCLSSCVTIYLLACALERLVGLDGEFFVLSSGEFWLRVLIGCSTYLSALPLSTIHCLCTEAALRPFNRRRRISYPPPTPMLAHPLDSNAS